ncbi:hypothetical protein [Vagococcus salmoninarum]|uniref:DNA topology modulation protein FlaR n=1 Tax=Vagococcus salmoninarum TaxID=2739 RepID=A0A429ZB88_9ENTE|nr:hypothetical protein [Vagococcus salmoninarum]MBE9389821.1 hypothetical protein [Vagococcus salmoninarum]RST90950.1 hypothetical protein CBF35_14915 [Vagococcus salmoninarum]
MKIRIIGHAGSGKTTLSKELSQEYGFSNIPLDSFLKQKDKKKRKRMLSTQLNKQDSWIVEGVQAQYWCKATFTEADIIIVLDYPLYIVQYRVIKRAITARKNATKERKKFLTKRAKSLLKWNRKFSQKLPKLKSKLYKHNSNLYIIRSPRDIDRVKTIIGFYNI